LRYGRRFENDELVCVTPLGRHLRLQPPASPDEATEPPADAAVEGLRRRLVRMAFDVHDGPMQELIALGYGLHELRKKVAGSPERTDCLTGEFDELGARLVETEQMLRSMMRSLEQTATGQTDIVAIVEEQVEAFKQRCPGTSVDVIAEGDVDLHTDSQRIALDRVLREALVNVEKHADATKVIVLLEGLRDTLVVTIQDDGRGFDLEASTGFRARVGLRSMRERLELIGGELSVDSRPGGPTTVTATIQKWRPAGVMTGPVALEDVAPDDSALEDGALVDSA
jgi:two-component system NarL family sensor kinase